MDINKFTQKAQEALQNAQTKAIRFNHQEVDGEHLLLVLLEEVSGLAPRLLAKLGVGNTVRASIYLYNNKSDIDKLILGIKEAKSIFKI